MDRGQPGRKDRKWNTAWVVLAFGLLFISFGIGSYVFSIEREKIISAAILIFVCLKLVHIYKKNAATT